LALEELVVNTAEGKVTKQQIAKFFKECCNEPELLKDKPKRKKTTNTK
jgi:hypothetical protein